MGVRLPDLGMAIGEGGGAAGAGVGVGGSGGAPFRGAAACGSAQLAAVVAQRNSLVNKGSLNVRVVSQLNLVALVVVAAAAKV